MHKSLLSFLLLLSSNAALAVSPVKYQASFSNAVHHEARISVVFSEVNQPILKVRMSRSSPGRYALHEFAKNVYQLEATDSKGNPLTVTRPDPYQWHIGGHDGTVKVSYTLFADHADGTYSAVDRTHAHLNIPATFIWARGMNERAIEIELIPFNENWKVATQLVSTDNPYRFTAPNLFYFMDSPIEMSNFDLRSWQVNSNGNKYQINLAVHHNGTAEEIDTFTEKAKAIVAVQKNIFGGYPDFDYGEYTFIACYLPHVRGDGMEHRNSTVLTSSHSLDEADFSQQRTLSHEFLHAWNAERIRPKSLEPFSFEKVNMSNELWFVEGFSNYYTGLSLLRADLIKRDKLLQTMTRVINAVNRTPGKSLFSAEGMSRQAPFADAAVFIDKTNFSNTLITHYVIGDSIAIALDLTLRTNFKNKNLDDYMSLVWQKFGKNEVYYDNSDLRITLGELVNNQTFADDFFSRYINGTEVPDYKKLLAKMGLDLKLKNPNKASLGKIELTFNGPEAIVSSATIIGSPAYQVGLERGDQIIQLDRRKIRSESLWTHALEKYKPGDTAEISYLQRGVLVKKEITFSEDSTLTIESYQTNDKKTTRSMKKRLKAWLGKSG